MLQVAYTCLKYTLRYIIGRFKTKLNYNNTTKLQTKPKITKDTIAYLYKKLCNS